MRRRYWLLLGALLGVNLGWPAWAADTVVYYLSDPLHSVTVVTDAQRNVLERTYYAPYGQVLNRLLRDGPGYGGHREDAATGLVYMQQRYYDAESGRFLSVDPVQTDDQGGSFNRYVYAAGNPYRFIDPDGRSNATGDERGTEVRNCAGSHTSCPSQTKLISVGNWSETGAARHTRAVSFLAQMTDGLLASAFQTPHDAAAQFGHVFAMESGKLGMEFGANVIFAMGESRATYRLADLSVSEPRLISSGASAGGAYGVPIPGRPSADYWGLVHTHYMKDGGFSPSDIIDVLISRGVNGYVFFPDGSFKSFSYSKYLKSGLTPPQAWRHQDDLSL